MRTVSPSVLWSSCIAVTGLVVLGAVVAMGGPSPRVVSGSGGTRGAPEASRPEGARVTLHAEPSAARPTSASHRPPAAPPPRDILARAMGRDKSERAAVIAFGAIRRGELGAGLLACLEARGAEDAKQARTRAGIDLIDAVEKIAIEDELIAVTGCFAGARWAELAEGGAVTKHGRATLYGPPAGAGETLGVWGDELLVIGRTRELVEQAIDRVEGRREIEKGSRPLPWRSGEISGSGPAADLLEPLPLLEEVREPLREALADASLQAKYQLAVADGGLQVTVRVTGRGQKGKPVALEALAETLEAGLEALQGGATPPGDAQVFARLFQHARVSRGNGAVTIDVDVPAEAVREVLAQCRRPPEP